MTKECYICKYNVKTIDYKDTPLLRKFVTPQSKIASRKRTGACALHQRKISRSVKQARVAGLIAFTTKTMK